MPAAAPPRRGRFFRPINLLTSLLLVFPLFLVYQIGVLAVPASYNGADLITAALLRLLHGNIGTYILVNLGLAIVFVVLMVALRRKNTFDSNLFVPVILESAIYALTMGSFIVFVMVDVLHVDPRLSFAAADAARTSPADLGLMALFVLSIGAGVHEELFFRLLLIPTLTMFFERAFKARRWLAITAAFLISAFLFSAAHHVVGGEPLRVGVFVYRLLSGLFFATLFQARGFAIAVYTHALYDMYVLMIRGVA